MSDQEAYINFSIQKTPGKFDLKPLENTDNNLVIAVISQDYLTGNINDYTNRKLQVLRFQTEEWFKKSGHVEGLGNFFKTKLPNDEDQYRDQYWNSNHYHNKSTSKYTSIPLEVLYDRRRLEILIIPLSAVTKINYDPTKREIQAYLDKTCQRFRDEAIYSETYPLQRLIEPIIYDEHNLKLITNLEKIRPDHLKSQPVAIPIYRKYLFIRLVATNNQPRSSTEYPDNHTCLIVRVSLNKVTLQAFQNWKEIVDSTHGRTLKNQEIDKEVQDRHYNPTLNIHGHNAELRSSTAGGNTKKLRCPFTGNIIDPKKGDHYYLCLDCGLIMDVKILFQDHQMWLPACKAAKNKRDSSNRKLDITKLKGTEFMPLSTGKDHKFGEAPGFFEGIFKNEKGRKDDFCLHTGQRLKNKNKGSGFLKCTICGEKCLTEFKDSAVASCGLELLGGTEVPAYAPIGGPLGGPDSTILQDVESSEWSESSSGRSTPRNTFKQSALHSCRSNISKKSFFNEASSRQKITRQKSLIRAFDPNQNLTLANFKGHKILGQGAYGSVISCTVNNSRTQVALKIMNKKAYFGNHRLGLPQDALNEDLVMKICKEAHSERRKEENEILNVPNMFQSWQDSKRLYIAMESLPMGSLHHFCYKAQEYKGKQNLNFCLYYGTEIARGLTFLNQNGIAHRDLKLENVALDKHGHARLIDFGLVAVDLLEPDSTTDSIVGTYFYQSPEMLQGRHSWETDWWSLGCVIYEMNHNSKLYVGNTRPEVRAKILNFTVSHTLAKEMINEEIVDLLIGSNSKTEKSKREVSKRSIQKRPYLLDKNRRTRLAWRPDNEKRLGQPLDTNEFFLKGKELIESQAHPPISAKYVLEVSLKERLSSRDGECNNENEDSTLDEESFLFNNIPGNSSENLREQTKTNENGCCIPSDRHVPSVHRKEDIQLAEFGKF